MRMSMSMYACMLCCDMFRYAMLHYVVLCMNVKRACMDNMYVCVGVCTYVRYVKEERVLCLCVSMICYVFMSCTYAMRLCYVYMYVAYVCTSVMYVCMLGR